MILLTNYSHLNFQSLKMAEITHNDGYANNLEMK